VQRAEINRKTVIEFAPESKQAEVYRELAKNIIENKNFVIPKPMLLQELEEMMVEFGIVQR
jgi:nitrogenase iron protein NifH